MSMSKKALVDAMLSYYQKDMDEKGKQLYVMLLNIFSDDDIKRGVFKAMEKEARFPVFSVLKKYIEEDKNVGLEDSSHKQAQYVKLHFETGNRPDFEDPVTQRIMSLYLPFADWKNRPMDEISKFFIPQFVKKYKEIAGSEAEKKRLPKTKALKSKSGNEKQRRNTNIPSDKEEREQVREQNIAWIEEQENANLGVLQLIRHGDAGCYSQGAARGLPRGGVFLFFDRDFQKNLKACPYFQETYPNWDFTCAKRQFLDGPDLNQEESEERIAEIRRKLVPSSCVKRKYDSLATESNKTHHMRNLEVWA